MIIKTALSTAFALALMVAVASAQVAPGPGGPPGGGGGGGGGGAQSQGSQPKHHSKAGIKAGLSVAVCTMSAKIAGMSANPVQNSTMASIGCAIGAMANPGAGVVGAAALLTAFSDQGYVTKTARKGGWTCRVADVDRVQGCRTYLVSKGIPVPKPNKNDQLALAYFEKR